MPAATLRRQHNSGEGSSAYPQWRIFEILLANFATNPHGLVLYARNSAEGNSFLPVLVLVRGDGCCDTLPKDRQLAQLVFHRPQEDSLGPCRLVGCKLLRAFSGGTNQEALA